MGQVGKYPPKVLCVLRVVVWWCGALWFGFCEWCVLCCAVLCCGVVWCGVA